MNAITQSTAIFIAITSALTGCDPVALDVPGQGPALPDLAPPPPRDLAVDAGPRPDGGPWFPAGTGLRRLPYLQNVGTTIARVMWTSTTSGGGHVRFRPATGGAWDDARAGYEYHPKETTGESDDYGTYVATLRMLAADTTYEYEVWENTTLLAAGLTFHTAWTDGKKPIRILAFGDSGSGAAPQFAVRDQFMKRRYDVFFHLGDIAYPTGSYQQFQSYFFDVYRDLLHGVPCYPVLGNHEYLTDNGQPFIDNYHLPAIALRPEDDERYYSFDLGDIHVVALDSNPQMLLKVSDLAADDMIDWLRADLAASKATWKIALFHHPVYSSAAHGSDFLVHREILGALEDGGIDLVLNGHDHDYERSFPVWKDMAAPMNPKAITYIVAGGGGGSLYYPAGGWFTDVADTGHYSFLDLTIEGCIATGKAISAEGDELDAFTLNGCDD